MLAAADSLNAFALLVVSRSFLYHSDLQQFCPADVVLFFRCCWVCLFILFFVLSCSVLFVVVVCCYCFFLSLVLAG